MGVDTFRRREAYYASQARKERPAHALLVATSLVALLFAVGVFTLLGWAVLDCPECEEKDGDGDEDVFVRTQPLVLDYEETGQTQPGGEDQGFNDPDARRIPHEDPVVLAVDPDSVEGDHAEWSPSPAQQNSNSGPVSPCQQYDAGGQVSDSALKTLATQIWISDTGKVDPDILGLNFQEKTNSSNTRDMAKQRLFKWGNLDLPSISNTYASFIALLDNYHSNVRSDDALVKEWGVEEEAEITNFLNDVLDTDIMHKLDTFLHTYGYVSADCPLRRRLEELWFTRFPRSSRYFIRDSSGFEHVFVGETKKTVTTGFHSWIRMYTLEQIADPALFDYKGYINKDNPYVLAVQFSYMDRPKALGSMFLGTSPEFDLAVYTLCLLTRTNRRCPVTLGGQDVTVQTYDMNRLPGRQIGTAYPIV